jgi:hypothetical protein
LYQAICARWLARNERQASDQQATFRSLYARLKTQLARLRTADDETGPAAYADLQETVDAMADLDLDALAARPALQAEARAARQLKLEMSRPQRIRLARIDLEILRNQDYAGDRHRTAQPTIRICKVSGTTLRALFELPTPEMPAAAGAGFEPVSLQMRTAVPFRARDTLLLAAFESDGGIWFHQYIEPPARGHVAAALAGLHRVAVNPQSMRAFAADPESPPPASAGGDVVATLRVVLAPGLWAELGQGLPDLP